MNEDSKDESAPLLSPDMSPDIDDQVDRAYKFLTHPKVASASLQRRITFLESKNCSRQVIDRALARANFDDRPTSLHQAESGTKKRRQKRPGKKVDPEPTPTRRGIAPLCCLVCLTLGVFVGLFFLLVSVGALPRFWRGNHHSDDDALPYPDMLPMYSYSYSYVEYYDYNYTDFNHSDFNDTDDRALSYNYTL